MKKKERYKILNYAKDQYNKEFGLDYQFKNLSRKDLHNLLKWNKHSVMCEWEYCCYGLYQNCWQDVYEEGVWNFTQKQVDDFISNVIDRYARYYRKDSRILYYATEDTLEVILVMRDIYKTDFLITFTNKKY